MSDFASGADAAAHLVLAPGAVPPATSGPVTADLPDDLGVDGDDGHHLSRVRRLRAGESVTVADGAGRWRPYVVRDVGRGRLELTANGPAVREPTLAPALTVVVALGKGHKPEHVVADLTELGVDRIVLLAGARSVVRWDAARAEAGRERLARVAREAAMQCRRARLPQLEGPVGIDDVAVRPGVVVGDPQGVALADVPDPGSHGWCAVVGAEGGLDPDERSRLLAAPGACALAVGPHVLRTETAAVAVAAALTTRRRPEVTGA